MGENDRQRELAPVLAHHFDEAGFPEQAARYYLAAGAEAAFLHANEQASHYCRRGLEIALKLENCADLLIALFKGHGRALEHLNRFGAAARNYKRLEKLGIERGDRVMELAGLAGRTVLKANPTPLYNQDDAVRLADKAIVLAEALGDQETKTRMSLQLANLYAMVTRFEVANPHADRTIVEARKLGDERLLANVLTDLSSHIFTSTGDFERAQSSLTEALNIWRKVGDKAMQADVLATLAEVNVLQAAFDLAHSFAEQSRSISRAIHNLWGESNSQLTIGMAYWERGRPDLAIETMEECIRLSEMAGFMVPQLVTRADLALIYAQLGDREEALALMSLVMKRVGPMGLTLENYFAGASALIRLAAGDVAGASRSLRVWDDRLQEPPRSLVDPPIYQAAVELALAQGDGESALTKANRLLRYLRSKGARLYMLPALLQKGHALMSLDRPDDARQTLLEAGELAQAVGARWTMWQAEAWLGRLAADPGERATHLDSARALIRSIADHTPEPLRDALLGRADVESLIDLAVD